MKLILNIYIYVKLRMDKFLIFFVVIIIGFLKRVSF